MGEGQATKEETNFYEVVDPLIKHVANSTNVKYAKLLTFYIVLYNISYCILVSKYCMTDGRHRDSARQSSNQCNQMQGTGN